MGKYQLKELISKITIKSPEGYKLLNSTGLFRQNIIIKKKKGEKNGKA